MLEEFGERNNEEGSSEQRTDGALGTVEGDDVACCGVSDQGLTDQKGVEQVDDSKNSTDQFNNADLCDDAERKRRTVRILQLLLHDRKNRFAPMVDYAWMFNLGENIESALKELSEGIKEILELIKTEEEKGMDIGEKLVDIQYFLEVMEASFNVVIYSIIFEDLEKHMRNMWNESATLTANQLKEKRAIMAEISDCHDDTDSSPIDSNMDSCKHQIASFLNTSIADAFNEALDCHKKSRKPMTDDEIYELITEKINNYFAPNFENRIESNSPQYLEFINASLLEAINFLKSCPRGTEEDPTLVSSTLSMFSAISERPSPEVEMSERTNIATLVVDRLKDFKQSVLHERTGIKVTAPNLEDEFLACTDRWRLDICVFSNIIYNAISALYTKQGRINEKEKQLKIEEEELSEEENNYEKKIDIRMMDISNSIILEISDNGPGFSAEVIGNIFKQGVTTKEGKGSGIGLVAILDMCRELGILLTIISIPDEEGYEKVIVKDEGALGISVEYAKRLSDDLSGTTFTLEIPLTLL